MTTITRERLLKIQQWRETYGPGSNVVLPAEEAEELARIALASLTAEPVSFDDLRDAVAEVSGGPAMEWSDIYKGHQAVPFINFNSLARIVDKFRAALLQGSQPVSNRDELQVSEIECDICGFKSTDPDGAHYCCEDNSND